MHEEVLAAANFIIKVMKMGHSNVAKEIGEAHLDKLANEIYKALIVKYTDHWFPDKPNRGSGFRSLRLGRKIDKVIENAIQNSGLSIDVVRKAFTLELTIWVDPRDVSYQMGEKGSISVLYEKKDGTQTNLVPSNGFSGPETSYAAISKPSYVDPSPSTTDADSESSASNSVVLDEELDTGNEVNVIMPSESQPQPVIDDTAKVQDRVPYTEWNSAVNGVNHHQSRQPINNVANFQDRGEYPAWSSGVNGPNHHQSRQMINDNSRNQYRVEYSISSVRGTGPSRGKR